MDVKLIELILLLKLKQHIILFKNNKNISGLITVEELIYKNYYDIPLNTVDFIKTEYYGGLLGIKANSYIEIYV